MEVRKRKQQIAFLQVPLLCQKFAACIGDMAMWADNEGEEDKESWPVSVYMFVGRFVDCLLVSWTIVQHKLKYLFYIIP